LAQPARGSSAMAVAAEAVWSLVQSHGVSATGCGDLPDAGSFSSASSTAAESTKTTAIAKLLLRIVDNILSQPREEKFRRLRKDSRALTSVLGPLPDAASQRLASCGEGRWVAWSVALKCCGWQEGGESFVLPAHALLLTLEVVRAELWEALGQAGQDCTPLLNLVLQWLPLRDLLIAGHSCRRWCVTAPEALVTACAAPTTSAPSGLARWARELSMSVSGRCADTEFSATCRPLEGSALDPLEEFEARVRYDCVAGGYARVSRVDARRWAGFGRAELSALVGLPAEVGAIERNGSARPMHGAWASSDGGGSFWAAVLAAARSAGWTSALGGQWHWTERSCIGGKAQLLICRRIAWVFSMEDPAGRTGPVSDQGNMIRWSVSTDVVQHLYLTR